MAQPWYPAGRRPEELAEEDADETLTAIRDTFARVAAAGDEVVAHDTRRPDRGADGRARPAAALSGWAARGSADRAWPCSIACRPRDDGLLIFHVKAIPGGWVSTALVDHTLVGDRVTLGSAASGMSLTSAGMRDLICVAGGTGLAPLKAIAEQGRAR